MKRLNTPLLESVYDEFHRTNGFSLHESLVFLGENGSYSHGLEVEGSDHDYIGVIIPPPSYVLVPFQSPVTHTKNVPFDVFHFSVKPLMEGQFYSLGKFMELLLAGNPNVVGLLWNRPQFIWATRLFEEKLIWNKDRFSSQNSVPRFIGFAQGEIAAMTKKEGDGIGEKRRNLVETYGYNTKSAVNAVRMMRTILEFSETGLMRQYRENDRDSLLQIKRGEWTPDQVRTEVDRIVSQVNQTKTVLPLLPNYEYAHKVMMQLYKQQWYYEWEKF